jgi:hypothetical protein
MKKVWPVVFSMFLVLISGYMPSVSAQPKTAVELVHPTDKIPKNFKTYSLFLICNPEWLSPEKSAGLFQLYKQFKNFGRTIGDDNAAVWFWKNTAPAIDSTLAQNVDVERSIRFCQTWKLTPSKGPHLVVTSTYPDEDALSAGLPANSAVFELGNMTPKQISDLLANLTDQLIAKGSVAASDPTAPTKPDLWVRLLEATQRTINSFGCAWSFKIDAGPVSANLHSCPAPPTT